MRPLVYGALRVVPGVVHRLLRRTHNSDDLTVYSGGTALMTACATTAPDSDAAVGVRPLPLPADEGSPFAFPPSD
jgi:hypothetical protein